MDTSTLTPAEHITAELEAAWQQPGAGTDRYSSTRKYQRIAGSSEDQITPEGVENPLWDIVRWLPAQKPWYDGGLLEPDFMPLCLGSPKRWEQLGVMRTALATRYAWSIISPGDVAWMVQQLAGRAVVEIGAGTDYWAWQLEQAGVDVAAYDPHPVSAENHFCKAGPYTTVLQDHASAVKHHQDRALLMVWPPYGGEHARHALSLYKGDLLIYAGEGHYGCTADDGFYELLDAEWTEVSVAPQHVTWWGIHCKLAAYQRKSG